MINELSIIYPKQYYYIMDIKKKKFTKFTPYDRILDGVESEDLIDDDDNTKIIRIYHRKANLKMFMLERIVHTEKEHIFFIKEIQKYEHLNSDGLLIIERWSYDMLIDNKLNKYYKFIILFETYSNSLRQLLENIINKKT